VEVLEAARHHITVVAEQPGGQVALEPSNTQVVAAVVVLILVQQRLEAEALLAESSLLGQPIQVQKAECITVPHA
jgi:hypothetical protein